MSGSAARTRARAARRASPPESVAGSACGIDPEVLHVRSCAVRAVLVVQTGQDEIERRGEAGQIGFLRQIPQPRVGLRKAGSTIDGADPGGDAKQRRLSRTVAAHERNSVAGRNRKLRAIEQRRAAERQPDISQLQLWRHMKQTRF